MSSLIKSFSTAPKVEAKRDGEGEHDPLRVGNLQTKEKGREGGGREKREKEEGEA